MNVMSKKMEDTLEKLMYIAGSGKILWESFDNVNKKSHDGIIRLEDWVDEIMKLRGK
jgi:hypothetical protein